MSETGCLESLRSQPLLLAFQPTADLKAKVEDTEGVKGEAGSPPANPPTAVVLITSQQQVPSPPECSYQPQSHSYQNRKKSTEREDEDKMSCLTFQFYPSQLSLS